MMATPATQYFASICCDWYMKYRKNKTESIDVMNDIGNITSMKLKNSNLKNTW